MEQLGLSKLIRMLRRLAGLTQEEVASEASIARPHLTAIEKGQRRASIRMQRRILASIFNLGLRIRLSERESGKMMPERFRLLQMLTEMTDDELERFMLSDNAPDIELKKEIAYALWKIGLDMN
jgi:transcriptional regulator with XRE-family HTH domain